MLKTKLANLLISSFLVLGALLSFTVPTNVHATSIKLGTYGVLSASGQISTTTGANQFVSKGLNFMWLQPSYPYSTSMSAPAAILKNAGKRIILRANIWDTPNLLSHSITDWTALYNNSGYYSDVVAFVESQITNIGYSNLYSISLSEEEPGLGYGFNQGSLDIAKFTSAYNAIFTSIKADYPSLKIFYSCADITWLTDGQIEAVDMNGLMLDEYTDNYTTQAAHLARIVGIGTALGLGSELYTFIPCATVSSSNPDGDPSHIAQHFQVAVNAGITNIGFYCPDTYTDGGNLLFKPYTPSGLTPNLNPYQHQVAMQAIIDQYHDAFSTSSSLTNPNLIAINSADVFQNILETGDFVFMVNYNIAYASVPTEPAHAAYYLALYSPDGSTLLALNPIPAYGNYPAAIYFSAAQAAADGITPNTAYKIYLSINPNMASINNITMSLNINYSILTLTQSNWMIGNQTAQRAALQYYVLTMAQTINPTQWITTVNGKDYVNTAGQYFFEQALPGITLAIPGAFQTVTGSITTDNVVSSGALNTLLTPEAMSGQKIADSFSGIASILGMQTSGRMMIGAFAFFIYLITASIIFVNSGNSIGGMVLASPILMMAALMGWLPIVVLFIAVMIVVTYALYYVFV